MIVPFRYLGVLLAIALPLFSTQAESKPMQPCTPNFEPGITVTVTDARTNASLEAAIVVKEDKFQEQLNIRGATASGQTIYGGAFERPGTYTVTVSKAGYQTAVLKNVRVTKNDCHVATQQLAIQLKQRRAR